MKAAIESAFKKQIDPDDEDAIILHCEKYCVGTERFMRKYRKECDYGGLEDFAKTMSSAKNNVILHVYEPSILSDSKNIDIINMAFRAIKKNITLSTSPIVNINPKALMTKKRIDNIRANLENYIDKSQEYIDNHLCDKNVKRLLKLNSKSLNEILGTLNKELKHNIIVMKEEITRLSHIDASRYEKLITVLSRAYKSHIRDSTEFDNYMLTIDDTEDLKSWVNNLRTLYRRIMRITSDYTSISGYVGLFDNGEVFSGGGIPTDNQRILIMRHSENKNHVAYDWNLIGNMCNHNFDFDITDMFNTLVDSVN